MPKLISQKNFSNLIVVGLTTNSENQTTLHQFPKSSFRSAKYQIQITRGSNYQLTEFLVVHDGNTTYNTEYATIKTVDILATFNSDIIGDNIAILTTPTSSNPTTFSIIGTAIKI